MVIVMLTLYMSYIRSSALVIHSWAGKGFRNAMIPEHDTFFFRQFQQGSSSMVNCLESGDVIRMDEGKKRSWRFSACYWGDRLAVAQGC